MCKWCETYRFTIRADRENNESHFLKPNYCPMCGHIFAWDDKDDNEAISKESSESNNSNNYFVVMLDERLCPDKNKRYLEEWSGHWDNYTLSDLKHAKQFSSVKSAKMYADWFFNKDDYVVNGILDVSKLPKVKAESTIVKTNPLSHFTKEDFYLKSDSGSVVNSIIIQGKPYKIQQKTLDKLNELVDAVNNTNPF